MHVGSGLLSAFLEDIFRDLLYVKVIKYIDDILVYTETAEEHVEVLDIVFKRLRDHGVTVNPKKMKLAWPQVSYLGMLVSENSVRIDPSRVQKVHEFPRPKNAKEVSRFIGFCSYFSRCIKNYADIAAPLNALRKLRTKFQWTDTCESSFLRLKQCLTNPPVLAMADFNKGFVLMTDASNRACGSVLLQESKDGDMRAIAYYSKKFTDQELS